MELTERQKVTYNLIKNNSKQNKKTTQREIYTNYPSEQFSDGYKWVEEKTHDHCIGVWTDIEAINKNRDVDELIISKNFEYWVAQSRDEALNYSKQYMRQALKKFGRYWMVVRKIGYDGQGKLDFVDSIFDEAKMEFIDTYGKEN